MSRPFARALDCVTTALSLPPEAITGPAKGSGVLPRARALVAYLASIEGGEPDTSIARAMNRDRSSVAHMLRVIESIREHPQIDSWISDLAASAINPPAPSVETLNLLVTANADDCLEPTRPAIRSQAPLPFGADKVLAPLAHQHNLTPSLLLSRSVPKALRAQAWRTLYQFTTPSGQRIFSLRRIASLSRVSHVAVAKALRDRH